MFSRSLLRRTPAYLLTVVVAAALTPAAPVGGVGRSVPTTPAAATAEAAALLSPATFANPPMSVRPMYRYWVPLAYTEDEVLRAELRDIAAAGGGGVEVAPFGVPGPGNQTNAFLAEYGWGTPRWAHKMEVITDEAAKLGLAVDQNLGPHYPATVPSLNSFNQPEAEQQVIFGREFNDAGATRSGPLPAPLTAPPSVTTKLCEPAQAGDEVLRVELVGGFAPGDAVTVGSGDSAEKVVVSELGSRTATCADLGVSVVTKTHATGDSVRTVARTTRIRTLVAQCQDFCGPATQGSIALVPSSVADVTAQVGRGSLEHSFATGNGQPWVLIDVLQTASGLIAQRGGYSATQPNYVVDHWSRGGVQIQANFWDRHILTDAVKQNLDRIGRGAVFEDSLELGESQKWTWGLMDEMQQRRGYDPTLLLPALLGAGIQGTHAPAFELPGVGAKVREDYRRTMSDLHAARYVAPMQRWARSHGLDFRAQSYGTPIASGHAATAAGVPEGESLNFGTPNPYGAEQDYRVVAGGAHVARRNIVSVECCAIFQGGYRSSLAGPNVGGQFGGGGDGSAVGGRYSQGLLDSVNKAYAGGVNQLVWHGYAYRDAPAGVGSSGRDGSWPGYHPWDIFGVISVNDEFGPRQANWADHGPVNRALARTQLVLQQGRAVVDLGVFYPDLGLAGNSAGVQEDPNHMLGTDSATSSAGYTYEYFAPELLAERGLSVEGDGGLFGDRSDLKALVLHNQETMSVPDAERLRDLAREGLKLFVVGAAPQATPGADPDGARLEGVIDELLAQPTVVEVSDESELPQALRAAGVRPAVTPDRPDPGLGLVRRQAGGRTYDFVYNRSAETVERTLTLTGKGRPYVLDTWTGRITPVARYTTGNRGTTIKVRVAPYDKVVLALDPSAALGPTPAVHALDSAGEVHVASNQKLVVRATKNGSIRTRLSNGALAVSTIGGLAPARRLDEWRLDAQTWTPGENQYSTVRTDHTDIPVRAGDDGALPSWREITVPVDLSTASGIGTYTTTVDLPATWSPSDGAFLDLGDVLDSAQVTVNGSRVVVNQSDRGRIDLGKRLEPGANTITVRVATTMFNAVRRSGDSNYQLPTWQRTGLMGPVILTPYRDSTIARSATKTTLRLLPATVRVGDDARAIIRVVSQAHLTGYVRLYVDGGLRRSVPVGRGLLTLTLPKGLRPGRHRVRVVYDGSAWLARSTADATLEVTRRR